jgi:hypothetical protein
MQFWKNYKLLKFLIIALLTSVMGVLVLLSNMDPDVTYKGKHHTTTDRSVTIVLIDGLSSEIFKNELEAGRLPHLQKLINQSTHVKNGIGSFPSMTGYAFYPFITGMDATLSGIYGLRWFDRSTDEGNLRNYVGRTNVQMNKDITTEYLNLFEINDDYYTASINTYMNRGVHHSLKTGWAHITSKYAESNLFKWLRSIPFIGEDISKNHFEHETLVTDLACVQLNQNPKVQWITYPSLDAHNHIHGTDSTYFKLLWHLDHEIMRLRNAMDALGQHDRMMVVVSDHGILDVEHNIDVPRLFRDSLGLSLERGKSSHLDSDELTTPIEDFEDSDGYFVINGNLAAYLYMKDPNEKGKPAWRKRTPSTVLEGYQKLAYSHNIPAFLSGQTGIDLVAYRKDDLSIAVMSGHEKAIIGLSANGKFKYQTIVGDPLSMGTILHGDSLYTEEKILSLTADAEYPYAVVRLWALLSREDAPDLVMTTQEGYDLARDYEMVVDNYKGGHGGIHRSLLSVPYIIYRPGQCPKQVHAARAEDVGATIMEYLRIHPNYSLSGRSIDKE